jgi:putative glutamine amidotransferase
VKIGLTYTGSDEKHRNYVKWLKGDEVRGITPEAIEIIRLSADDKNFDEIKSCDALILSGGIDIHPSLYGGSGDYQHQPPSWEKERDLFEKSLFEYALEQSLPVLGVCRGLQLINVCCNGTLKQDLGEQRNETHKNEPEQDKLHPVEIEKGTLLYDIAGMQRGEANSAHHQAIDKLGEGLKWNSRADDGTIEGIEWKDNTRKPFMIAVQWHPERMFTNQLPDAFLYRKIRDRFIKEIKKEKIAK